jgi:FemAB family
MIAELSSSAKPFRAQVDQVTEGEWNLLLEQFADASFYQTWAYGAVSWGEKCLSHLVLFCGARPMALAQLRLVRVPLLGRGVAYLRWGPVCVRRDGTRDEAVFRAMGLALVEEYVRRRRLLLRIIPRQFQQDLAGEQQRDTWVGVGFRLEAAVKPYRTLRVDLAPAAEVLRKQLDQKWRNQLNGAERNGLSILEGTSDELYGQFLGLYRDMMARKQFETTVDVVEFQRIQQRLPERQKMLILISQKDGQIMTGLVGSVVGDTGIYLLGATSDAGMKTKGSYLLQWHMIQRLKERGCRWYDLGGINPLENPGVYHFKQGMGGQDVCELGRFSLSGGMLSVVSVIAGERLRAAAVALKKLGRGRNTATTVPAASPGPFAGR